MKKYLFAFFSMVGLVSALVACGSDSDSNSDEEKLQQEVEKRYFTIDHSDFTEGSFPQATTEEKIDGFSVNQSALAGGMNFVTVVTEKTYNKFYIGLRGVNGYWTYTRLKTAKARRLLLMRRKSTL